MQTTHRKYRRGNKVVGLIKGVVSFFIFSSFSFITHAQIVGGFPTGLSLPGEIFNKQFIRENKIKIIRAAVVDKADGEIIRDKGLAENFLFDTAGNMVRHYYNEVASLQKTETDIPAVYNSKGKVIKKSFSKINYEYQYDTLGTEFFYTSNGFLQMKRTCIGDFYNTTYYEYFGDGMVSRETKCKETNIAKKGEPFKLGMQTVLSDEKCDYEVLSPIQIKKKFLNDEGKPYKQGILNFENGKLVSESYEFTVGYIRTGTDYRYDTNGNILEKMSYDNSSGSNQEKIMYEYNNNGSLTWEKHYKNGIQTNEIVFLYNTSTAWNHPALLTSQADRQIQKESIKIIKYQYEFY